MTFNNYLENYVPIKTHEEILIELEPRNVDIKVDVFEEIILQDIAMGDNLIQMKLSRNLTKEFNDWTERKLISKEQLKINIKGETRSNFGDTEVLMSNFENKRLDLLEIGNKVFSLNLDTLKFEEKEIIEVFENGVKECCTIKLRGGKIINSSVNHKYLCYDKILKKGVWREVKDLTINDYIAIPSKLEFYKQTNYSLNEIELLGFWLGDGYMINTYSKIGKCIQFDLSKQDKINYLNKLLNNTKLNYGVSAILDNGHKNINWNKGFKFTFSKKDNSTKGSDDFTKFIYSLKLENCLCHDKFIPLEIKNGTEKELYALLSGLFSSDGFIDKTKGIFYNTTSLKLINDIKIILTKLGIIYNENKKLSKFNAKEYLSYQINISKISTCKTLINNLTLRTEMQQNFLNYINSKNELKLKEHDIITLGDITYKKIKSIDNLGYRKVYDIEVKDNHNYIGNLILTHNSGKSLIGIRILYLIWKYYKNLGNEKPYTAEKVICANQKILRQKLNTADFGDFYQIDENAFANVGTGSMTEMQQLKDINNIIAKQNIHMIYITPQTFLPTGATTGLAYFGKDVDNWVSRFLLYSLKSNMPSLLGYVVFDVGNNFKETGCLIYKKTGGCTNPKRLKINEIEKDYIFHSSCIDKTKLTTENILDTGKTCPFYNVCSSFMCSYEKLKDEWIAKEMKGGISERESEKLEVSLKIFETMAYFDTKTGGFRLNASNGKELKLKIKMKLPFIVNTKYTGVEVEEIITIVISLLKLDFLEDTCKLLELDYKIIMDRIIATSTTNKAVSTPNEFEEEEQEEKPKKKKSKKVEKIETEKEIENLELSQEDKEFIKNFENNQKTIMDDNLKYLEEKKEEEEYKEKNYEIKQLEYEKEEALEYLEEYKKNNSPEMNTPKAIVHLSITEKELIEIFTGREQTKKDLNLTDEEIINIVKENPKNYFDLLENEKLKKLELEKNKLNEENK